MKKIITLLVEDDIKQTRLISKLEGLDDDSLIFLTNTSRIIFELLHLKNSICFEEWSDSYFKKIEEAADDKNGNDSTYIETITNWLTSKKNNKKAKNKLKKKVKNKIKKKAKKFILNLL